ncbi:MAG: hypothetical protein PHH91_11845 [Desulfuromonadaceae bacterium]|nr:hypothetical protein [Desulfuromonadaceae bacterium]
MKRSKIGTCCICGQTNVQVTTDHVPPKTIFVKPRPQNTITIRACNTCNNGSSAHDQSFSVFLSMQAIPSHEGAKLLFNTKTIDTLNSNEKLRNRIIATAKPVYLATEQGVIYDNAMAILPDAKVYNSTLERTVRGLYYHHYKEILGDKAAVEINIFKQFPDELMQITPELNHNEIGHKGEFIYKYRRIEESPMDSIWLLQFYNSLYAAGWTIPV